MIDELLIELLAQGDAILGPVRDWKNTRRVSAIQEMRSEFQQFGLPLPKLGLDFAERKRVEQFRNHLEQSGEVIFHRTLGRRSHWKLVDEADWRLRGMATGYGYFECLTAMLVLRELADAGHANNKHVGDWEIAGVTASGKNTDRIHDVAAILAPAMVRGWASNWSDIHGRNGYQLTKRGRKFLSQPLKPPMESTFESERGVEYLAFFDEAFKNLSTLKPRREAVPIPLGAGDWPGSDCRKNIPSIFTARGDVRQPAEMARAILKSKGAKK